MTDHYGEARYRNRASTRALMKRSGYADGGSVDMDAISANDYSPDNVHGFSSVDDSAPRNPPRPTPRPPFGADDQMIEQPSQRDGTTRRGHINTKTNDVVWDDKGAK